MRIPQRTGLGALAVFVVTFLVYAATAARTITWWDGAQYPLAAVTLGIAGPPGSLLLTLAGWLVSKIPIVHPVAFRLNLFAALMAATLAGLVAWMGGKLASEPGRQPGWPEAIAGAFAGLVFALGFTPWTYATQFTPYVLSEVWTALILITALAWWWRPEGSAGYARLFVLFLLLGLDVSVHRTNLLLLPAAIVWIVIRRPPAASRVREGGAAAAGLSLGLAFHLLLIPLAARHPSFMVEDPSDLASWWSYVSLDMKGGAFLFNIFPRTADFLRVQVADYVVFLAHNLWELFFLPAALIVLGWLAILRRHPRPAWGLLVFFVCAGPGAIVYFNLPHGYFRPIDRHYLPSLVILSPWMAVGAAIVLRHAARARFGTVWAAGVAIVLALAPLLAWSVNRKVCDLSRNRFAENIARDLIEPLPERAILFTNGDNDSFPPWYLQQAEGVRRDVTVVNLPLTNQRTYIAQLRRTSPDLGSLLADEPGRGLVDAFTVAETTFTVTVGFAADRGIPDRAAVPDSIVLHAKGPLYGQDRMALDLLRLVQWRRPIFLACTVAPDNVPWIRPLARLDGLAYRIVPTADSSAWDVDHARRQMERMSYAGFADRTVTLDISTSLLMQNYVSALLQIAMAEARLGHTDHARETLRLLDQRIPKERLGGAAGQFAPMRAAVEAALPSAR